MQRNEIRKFEDISRHERHSVICCFFAEIRKKGRSRIRTRKFGCHAVLVVPSFKKTVAETTVFCEIVNLQIQGNNLKRAQGYGKRKNASRALNEAIFLDAYMTVHILYTDI